MSSVTVHFHGLFKTYAPDPITVVANTAVEAVDAVTRQIPGFKPNAFRGKHTVKVKGYEKADDLFAPLKSNELHLWPAVQGGGGNGGFFKIVLGAALIAASFIPGLQGLAVAGLSMSSLAFSMGVSLVLGGLLEIISPAPKIDMGNGAKDPEASKYLGAGQNTVKIGTRIPLLYGTDRAYGHYISFNIDAKDVSTASTTSTTPAPSPTTSVPKTGYYPGTFFGPITASFGDKADSFKITDISGGNVYKADQTTVVVDGTTITPAEATAGLYFKGDSRTASFRIQALLGGNASGSPADISMQQEPDNSSGQ